MRCKSIPAVGCALTSQFVPFFTPNHIRSGRIEDLTEDTVHLTCYSGDDPPQSSEISTKYVDASGANITIQTAGDCRRALVEMARIASEALGEEIELPQGAGNIAAQVKRELVKWPTTWEVRETTRLLDLWF